MAWNSNFTTTESAFNTGAKYMQRTNNILTLCWMHSQKDDVHGWLRQLLALRRELVIVAFEELKEEGIKNKFTQVITEYNKGVTGGNRKKLLFMLDDLEMELRLIAQNKKMLLPNREDISVAVLKR